MAETVTRNIIRDLARAERNCAWIEKWLKVTKGGGVGEAFRLRQWQRDFIYDVYAPVYEETGRRVVRRAVFSVARKNGKTELSAALILLHLIGPEAEVNGELYSAANDKEQAAVVFEAVRQMIELTPAFKSVLKVIPNSKRIRVTLSSDPRTGKMLAYRGSTFRALSKDAKTKHGLNPTFVHYDELAQSKAPFELFSTLSTSMGARLEPLLLITSTQNDDPTHRLSEMIDVGVAGDDPTRVCHLYAADDECDILDEEQWRKANPALGDFRDYDDLKSYALEAAKLPSLEQEFRLLYLNQRVSLHAPLIPQSTWKKLRSDKGLIAKEPIYLALDMADAGLDLCALVAVSATNGTRVGAWFWKPSAHLKTHTERDGFNYVLAAKQGELLTCDGVAIDPEEVAKKIAELTVEYQVLGMAYDQWRVSGVLRHFDKIGIFAHTDAKRKSGLRIIPWAQSLKDMAPAVDALERDVLTGDLQHSGNTLLTWNIANALVTKPNSNGERKIDKGAVRFRIDGAVALAMACGLKQRERGSVSVKSAYEKEDYVFEAF